jgi:hypothetical protein
VVEFDIIDLRSSDEGESDSKFEIEVLEDGDTVVRPIKSSMTKTAASRPTRQSERTKKQSNLNGWGRVKEERNDKEESENSSASSDTIIRPGKTASSSKKRVTSDSTNSEQLVCKNYYFNG